MNPQEDADAGRWTTLELTGRLDAVCGAEVERTCLQALERHPRLALDLRLVNYMSSAGLRVLLSALKASASRNGALALVAPQANVREILEMSGFTKIFLIVDDAAGLTSCCAREGM